MVESWPDTLRNRRVTVSVLSLACLLSPIFNPASGSGKVTGLIPVHTPTVMEVLPQRLHLRAEPAFDAISLALVPKGTLVCVIDTRKAWHGVRVSVTDTILAGWMAKGFLGDPDPPVQAVVAERVCAKKDDNRFQKIPN